LAKGETYVRVGKKFKKRAKAVIKRAFLYFRQQNMADNPQVSIKFLWALCNRLQKPAFRA